MTQSKFWSRTERFVTQHVCTLCDDTNLLTVCTRMSRYTTVCEHALMCTLFTTAASANRSWKENPAGTNNKYRTTNIDCWDAARLARNLKTKICMHVWSSPMNEALSTMQRTKKFCNCRSWLEYRLPQALSSHAWKWPATVLWRAIPKIHTSKGWFGGNSTHFPTPDTTKASEDRASRRHRSVKSLTATKSTYFYGMHKHPLSHVLTLVDNAPQH